MDLVMMTLMFDITNQSFNQQCSVLDMEIPYQVFFCMSKMPYIRQYVCIKEKGKLVMEKKNDVENKKEFWTEFCEILKTDEMRHWFDEFKKRNKISKT